MCFILMQGMAPLAHAHVDGDHAEQHAHLAGVDMSWFDDHASPISHANTVSHASPVSATQQVHGEYHAAMVCMPPECSNKVLLVEQPAIAAASCTIPPCQHVARIQLASYLQSLLPAPYTRPSSHAPPV